MSFEDYRDPIRPRPVPVPVPYVPPPPQPAPQPTTPAVASVNRWNAGILAFLVLFTALNVGLLAYREFRPNPNPAPVPVPTPVPAPVKPVAYPDVQKAAAAFFAAYPARYRTDVIRIPQSSYNDLMTAQLKDRDTLGTTLGEAINAHTYPLLDDKAGFKDAAQAQAVWSNVAVSLQAGIVDAARGGN